MKIISAIMFDVKYTFCTCFTAVIDKNIQFAVRDFVVLRRLIKYTFIMDSGRLIDKKEVNNMIDISVREQLEQYLLDKGIISKDEEYSFNYCKGGVSGTVVFVYAGKKELIVKQALAQLKTKDTWLCDPNRMNIEKEGNRIYNEIVPENAPKVYFYDHDNYIFGREAAPESCTMWKADLLSGLYDFQIADKAIDSLAKVHNGCAYSKEVEEIFGDKAIFYDLRISPYIEFTVGKHPELREFADSVNEFLMGPGITLVHGDYSPKNIMVDGRKIYILDYEVGHYGHPAFDLAFFSNHFLLKTVKNKQWADTTTNMLKIMLDKYFSEVKFMDPAELEKCFVKTLALLFIARVDGKSPAEYITDDGDKDIIRKTSFRMINEGICDYNSVIKLIKEMIGGK